MGSWKEGIREWSYASGGGRSCQKLQGGRACPTFPPSATWTGLGKSQGRDTSFKFAGAKLKFNLAGAKFKLAEQNFLLCLHGWIFVLPSECLPQHHTCKTQYPCRTITVKHRFWRGHKGTPVRHRALEQPAVKPLKDLYKHNSEFCTGTNFFHSIPSSVCKGLRVYLSVYKGVWPWGPEQHSSGVNKVQSAQPTASFCHSQGSTGLQERLSLGWRQRKAKLLIASNPEGLLQKKWAWSMRGEQKRECFTVKGHQN